VGPSASTFAVNQTCSSACGTTFLTPNAIIANALNTSQTEYAAGGTTPVTPSVAYQVINQSSTGFTLSYDQTNYNALEAGALVSAMAFCGTANAGDYPPIAFTTVLSSNAGTYSGADSCGYAQGIEFSVSYGGGSWIPCTLSPCTGAGLDVTSPSATTEAMSATLAAMKSNHPTWTWGDIKAALRQTAGNWSSGYAASGAGGLGYGNINYPSAVALSNASALYLQPPGLSVSSRGSYAALTLFPFQQTRRVADAVYVFTSNPASALQLLTTAGNNTLTYAQVNALGGTLIFQSSGTPATAQTVFYFPPSSSTYYFVGFTVDNATLSSADFSRGETFSSLSVALTVSQSCSRQ
jgi:hypothetical protein